MGNAKYAATRLTMSISVAVLVIDRHGRADGSVGVILGRTAA